jgi:hypothetical protein
MIFEFQVIKPGIAQELACRYLPEITLHGGRTNLRIAGSTNGG